MMQRQHPQNFELLLLLQLHLVIVFPVMVSAEEDSHAWEGTGILLIVLSFLILLLIAFVGFYIHRCGNGCLGAATGNHHQPQGLTEAARGLDATVFSSLPMFLFSEIGDYKRKASDGEGVVECAVCLHEFKDQDMLCALPNCCHVFHSDCIAPWLACHVTCPVCRRSLALEHGKPKPTSSSRHGSSVSMPPIMLDGGGHMSSGQQSESSDRDHSDQRHCMIQIEEAASISSKGNQSGPSLITESSMSSIVGSSIGRISKSHSTSELLVGLGKGTGRGHTINKINNWSTMIILPPKQIMMTTMMSSKSDYRSSQFGANDYK